MDSSSLVMPVLVCHCPDPPPAFRPGGPRRTVSGVTRWRGFLELPKLSPAAQDPRLGLCPSAAATQGTREWLGLGDCRNRALGGEEERMRLVRLTGGCVEFITQIRTGAGQLSRERMAEGSKIQLFVKASADGENIGHCPFCQRLFMVLLLKGVPFTLTTVDTKRSLDVLKDFAPGAQLPVLLYDGDPKTDTIKVEEFLEETLAPPEFPSLAPKCKESILAGNDVFHRFSAYIKNPIPAQDETLLHALLKAFCKLDQYLSTPLDYELMRDPQLIISRRRFLDGDQMTLADCSLLPKLNIVNVVCQHYRQAGIPRELRSIGRYLECAAETKEFQYTCPNPQEIIQAYHGVVRQPQ